MLLTDREWLRFVTFALLAGGALGAAYTGILAIRGHPPMWAIGGGVIAPGVIGVIVHVAMRWLIDRASEPPAEEPDPDPETESGDPI